MVKSKKPEDNKLEDKKAETASYQTKREHGIMWRIRRKNSVFISPAGVQYSPGKVLGKGQFGEVRSLESDQKDSPPLVVKRPKENVDPFHIEAEIAYLKAAYPHKIKEIHYAETDKNDRHYRLVMPYFGNTTLFDILTQNKNWNSLNRRYAYYKTAVQEFSRLHDELELVHGDMHAKQILFNEKGECAFIDGTLKPNESKEDKANDLEHEFRVFKSMTFNLLKTKYGGKDINDADKALVDKNKIYLRVNNKKNVFEYDTINLQGKLIHNQIKPSELKAELSEAQYKDLERIMATPPEQIIYDELIALLPAILEVTSKRGETGRHHQTYMSENFASDFLNCNTTEGLVRVLEVEMTQNNKKILQLNNDIKDQLLLAINAAMNSPCEKKSRDMLTNLSTHCAAIETKTNNNSEANEATTHNLMSLLYQTENITANSSARSYVAAKPHFDAIRENLRVNLHHLPELPVSSKEIISRKLSNPNQISSSRGVVYGPERLIEHMNKSADPAPKPESEFKHKESVSEDNEINIPTFHAEPQKETASGYQSETEEPDEPEFHSGKDPRGRRP